MARKVFVRGNRPWWNLVMYSEDLMPMKTNPRSTVSPMKSRNFPKSLRTRDAHAMTMVTLEEISTRVLVAARGTLRIDDPRGQCAAPPRKRI